MEDWDAWEQALARAIAYENHLIDESIDVDQLESEMKNQQLDIVSRERAAIGRYLLTKGVDFMVIKTVVCGKHWGAIHPWNDEDGNFVSEKMLQDPRFK